MKFAFRVNPVCVGTTLCSSCVLGDETQLLPSADWIPILGDALYATCDGAIFQAEPWNLVALFVAKKFGTRPSDLEIHSDKDSYLVTWSDDGKD